MRFQIMAFIAIFILPAGVALFLIYLLLSL
jgi:hypothetical protein